MLTLKQYTGPTLLRHPNFYVLTLPTYKVFMCETQMSEGTLCCFVWYHFICVPCLCPNHRDERNVF